MTGRVHAEWARRVAAEYRSAAIAAQVQTWAIQAGLPVELLHAAGRVVGDELDHAAISRECLVALGGSEGAVELDAASLLVPTHGGLLTSLAEAVARDFCLGETFAVPLFAAMREEELHPAVGPVLERILADEARHRAFGWEALDALLAVEPGLGPWLARGFPVLLSSFRGYREPPEAPPLGPEERACGLLDHGRYAEIVGRCLEEDVWPRLRRRGIEPDGSAG